MRNRSKTILKYLFRIIFIALIGVITIFILYSIVVAARSLDLMLGLSGGEAVAVMALPLVWAFWSSVAGCFTLFGDK